MRLYGLVPQMSSASLQVQPIILTYLSSCETHVRKPASRIMHISNVVYKIRLMRSFPRCLLTAAIVLGPRTFDKRWLDFAETNKKVALFRHPNITPSLLCRTCGGMRRRGWRTPNKLLSINDHTNQVESDIGLTPDNK